MAAASHDQGVTVVLDNGAHTVKAGFAGADDPQLVVPNCCAKPRKETYRRLVGAQTADVNLVGDFAQLHYARPFERGYLVNWETQTAVWDQVFSADHLAVDAGASTLFVTEPAGNLPRFKAEMDEVVFEYYGFASYARATPA